MKHSLLTRMLSLFLVLAMLVPCFPQVMAEEGEVLPIAETTEATEAETTEATEPSEQTQETTVVTEPDMTESSETTEPEETEETTEATEESTEATEETEAPTEETTEATEATEATEETTEPTEETEPAELPYGLIGLPVDYTLNSLHADKREQMLAHNVQKDAEIMVPDYDYISDEILIEAENQEEAQLFADAYNGQLVSYDNGLAVIRLSSLTAAEAVNLSLEEDVNLPVASYNHIIHVEPMYSLDTIELDDVPERLGWSDWADGLENPDPYLLKPAQNTYQYMHDVVGSYAAWGVNTGRSDVRVGVIDTGVDATHPDLKGKVTSVNVGQGTGDPDGHGTHVAGIIAATINNGRGGAGIAPNVSLYAYRTANSSGGLVTSAIISAITDAANKRLDVINMSLGGSYYNYSFANAIKTAHNKGVTVVVAMGNDGSNIKQYPAGYDYAIAVGATDRSNYRASFSNYGAWCDVSAPGVEIMSTVPGGGYQLMDGTSMATPVVAGVCALYISWNGNPGPDAMEKILEASCVKCPDKEMGAGIVNIANMIDDKPDAPAYWICDASDNILYTNAGGTVYKNQAVVCEGNVQLGTFGLDESWYIVYTLDGKNPSVKDGQIMVGQRCESYIELAPYAGSSVTIKAMQVSGLGIPGAVLTLKVNVAESKKVTGVSISGPVKLMSGKSAQFTATVAPVAKADQSVTWSISKRTGNLSAAKINAKGVLTTPAGGTGTITVKAVSKANTGKSATKTVTVTALTPVKTITLNYSTDALFVGKTRTLKVTSVQDAGGNVLALSDYGFQWTSSNEKVATVNQSGKVTAIAKGKATITCKALDGSNKSAKCTVTVNQQVTEVTITGATTVAAGGNTSLKATVLPSTASNKKVTWSRYSGPSNVTVDAKNGKVTVPSSVANGTTIKVKATAADGFGASKIFTLKVMPKVTKVEVALKSSYTGKAAAPVVKNNVLNSVNLFSADLPGGGVDNVINLKAKFSGPSSASFEWTSSKPSVASVDSNGKVTAHSAGSVTITATALDGSKKKDNVSIKVTNPVSYIGIKSGAQQMSLPFLACGFGKSVSNKVVFGETYGKPSNSKVTWDYQVWTVELPSTAQYWSDLEEVKNVTSTFKSKNLITVSNGKLNVKAGVKEEWNKISVGTEFKVKVIARATDGSNAQAVIEYLLMPTCTFIETGGPYNLKKESGYNVPFLSDQWEVLDVGGCAFTVTSSNPDIVGADGVSLTNIYSGYKRYAVHVVTGRKAGTAKITITATDGSNKKASFTVKVS